MPRPAVVPSLLPPWLLAALLALFAALLPSCGGGGEATGGGVPVDDPGGNGRDPGNEEEEEPPPDLGDLEGFGIWPGSEPSVSPGARLSGFVGYRNSPRLAAMTGSAAAGGLYRRTWTVSDPPSGQYLGEDFALADAQGMRLWLHCVGTPSDLSPHPELTENEYGTGLPGYARYMPTDPIAWADRVIAFIASLEQGYGVTPDYVELWNEPERVEWFTGTLEELLDFYDAAASRIRQARPGIRLGGPGLAGYASEMGGTESVLLAFVRHAQQSGAPLDFVSWHHYAPGNEILYSDMPDRVRALADSLDLPELEAVVSEWNIYPSAEGAVGPEFDGAHCAANLAGFLATAYQRHLDGNMFFLDQDEDNDPGITDLLGVSLGALTQHGIKKPVYRVLETVQKMSGEDVLPVYRPEQDEFNLQVYASRSGMRTRIVISNDVVDGTWMFANRSRDHGMEPGWLYPLWLAAGGTQADVASLMAQGLTEQQALDVLGFMPEVYAAARWSTDPRDAVLTILGIEDFRVSRVLRFDATHNAPATQRAGILAELEQVEEAAAWQAADAASDYLEGWGYFYTAEVILAVPVAQFLDWADLMGISYGVAVNALKLMRDTLRDERLAESAFLNSLPETRPEVETAAAAGIQVDGRKLRFQMEPETLLVIDLRHD